MKWTPLVSGVFLAGSTLVQVGVKGSDGRASFAGPPRVVTLGRVAAKASKPGATAHSTAADPGPLEPRRRAKLTTLILESVRRALVERRIETRTTLHTMLVTRASERLLAAHDRRALELGGARQTSASRFVHSCVTPKRLSTAS